MIEFLTGVMIAIIGTLVTLLIMVLVGMSLATWWLVPLDRVL